MISSSISADLIAFHPEIAPCIAKFNRYVLASDASFADKFKYCLYRIFNAVKAIFNQSDWQCARRDLILTHVPAMLKNNFGPGVKFDHDSIEIIVMQA